MQACIWNIWNLLYSENNNTGKYHSIANAEFQIVMLEGLQYMSIDRCNSELRTCNIYLYFCSLI